MKKYWRLKRDDNELDSFISYLKSKYKYKEEKSNGIYPSKVSYSSNTRQIKDTIIVTVHMGIFMSSFIQEFSLGTYVTKNGKIDRIMIEWNEDNEKNITNFSSKLLRKEKLKQINKKI